MLKRKLWRDLLKNKMQFISIFLMSFLGLFVFVGLDAEGNGLGTSATHYYEESNLADLWAMGKTFTVAELKKIENISGIRLAERRLQLNATAKLDNDPYMQLNFIESNEVSKLHIISGEEFNPTSGGIWINDRFAKGQNLTVGDTISIEFNGLKITEVIKGIIMHPEYVYFLEDNGGMIPDYGKFGYGFLSSEEFPAKDQLLFNQVIIDVKSDYDMAKIKEELKEEIHSDKLIVSDRKQSLSYSNFDSEKEQHITMGFMFPVVFLLIAILGIVTTMTRMTANQRIQIGTLKALGFTKKTITMHYMSYGFVISLVGGILGAYIGYRYLPLIFRDNMASMYVLPVWSVTLSSNSYYAIIINVLISTLVSYLACRKELEDPPATTLKPAVPKKNKPTMIETSPLWEKLSFSTKWNYRDMIRNKMRTMMGIVGVIGCTMLMISAFGCKDSISDMSNWMYQEIMTCKTKILFNEQAQKLAKIDYAKEYAGQLMQETTVELTAKDIIKTGSLTVLDAGNYIHFQDEALNHFKLKNNEVALTYKMAKNLGVKKGDFIQWHIIGDDKWVNTRIEQLYRSPTTQGIAMNQETFEQLEFTFSPTALLTNKTPKENLIDQDDIQGIQDITQMKEDLNKIMEMMNMMVGILIGGAVVLGIVVLYNLGVLTFVEKTREIATLKVLGFNSKRIRGILQMQNIWVTMIGIVIGLPIGYQFLTILLSTMSDSQDVVPVVSTLSYLYSIGGTFLVSLFVNTLLSGKVNTINMVDALKGVE